VSQVVDEPDVDRDERERDLRFRSGRADLRAVGPPARRLDGGALKFALVSACAD
jgi:hypothetical protein